MVKYPKQFFMCKYYERSGFWNRWDSRVYIMSAAIQTLHLIFHNTPHSHPTPKWPKHDGHATGQRLSGTHSLQAKANTEVYNRTTLEKALCSRMHQITAQTTARFCHMVLLIFSRSHQISKHSQTLNKQYIISLCNVINLCYMVSLMYSVSQELDITYNQHTVKAFGQSQSWSYILQLYYTHFLCPMCSIGQPQIV
jgi:hypothetical protein